MAKTLQSVTIRMYCTGFGDCFLLTYQYADNTTFQMLIDCGVRGGNENEMVAIATHLRDHGLLNVSKKEGKQKKLDVLVITHEHEDHISGFRQARKVFDTIEIGQLWLGWTEKPGYDHADDWQTYKNDARNALRQAFTRLSDETRNELLADGLGLEKIGLPGSMLGEMMLFEVESDTLRAATKTGNAKSSLDHLAVDKPDHDNAIFVHLIKQVRDTGGTVRYFDDGDLEDSLIDGIRFYVLGPPPIQYIRMGESHASGELYVGADYFADTYSFGRALNISNTFLEHVGKAPFDEEYIIPVDFGDDAGELPEFCRKNQKNPADFLAEQRASELFDELQQSAAYQCYFGATSTDKSQEWRSISDDWWQSADNMALKLNSYTNNTSLVLAIELTGTDEVLFFPGDAQYGVWYAWDDDETKAQKAKENNTDYQRKYVWQVTNAAGVPQTVTVNDLLKRTVFYKVGHHGSHNATPKRVGLEKMKSSNLFALLPTDAERAKRYGWDAIPYRNLLEAFKKTDRLVQYARADMLADAKKLEDHSISLDKSSLTVVVDEANKYINCQITLPAPKPDQNDAPA